MNIFRINFDDLYRRHLCRHGHFGINVLHLVAVVGTYVAVFGIVHGVLAATSQPTPMPILVALTLPWYVTVISNVPLRVSAATGLFVAALLAVFNYLPEIPVWIWVVLIFAMHQFQQYSHRLYHMHKDMSEFEGRYPKGRKRFVLLLVYELPILLNYLLFNRSDWVFLRQGPAASEASDLT